MLLRLAYLTVTNMFAALRLLPISDRCKHAEILALSINSPPWNGSSGQTGSSSLRKTGRSLPLCWHHSPVRFCDGSGYWSGPTPCCAGTAT